jgi:hypothetical protein
MGMGRNTCFGEKGCNTVTLDDILKIISTKYSREHRELPQKFN